MLPTGKLHWVLLGLCVLSYLIILIHESGHALMARFYGRKIQRIQIGAGWLLCSMTIWGTQFRLGFPPLTGTTTHAKPKDFLPAKRHLKEQIGIVAAGPLFCAVVVSLVWTTLKVTTDLPILTDILAIVLIIEQLLNLLPPYPDGKKLKILIANYRSLSRNP